MQLAKGKMRNAHRRMALAAWRLLSGVCLLTGSSCSLFGGSHSHTPLRQEQHNAASPTLSSSAASEINAGVARPALYRPFVDPSFGTTIMRVTDPTMTPGAAWNPGGGLRHEYARFPALNADNTKVAVRVLGGADRGFFEIRELASGKRVQRIAVHRGDPEMSWHPTAPNLLFYRSGNEIHLYDAVAGRDNAVFTFPQYFAISTRGEGRASDDWRYYAFLGFPDQSFSHADIVVFDLVEKRVVANWPNAGKPDWVSMSPSGAYVVAQWTDGQGTRLYDRATLQYVRTLFSDAAHSDFAFDAEGNEVLVYHATSKGQILELGSPQGSPIAQVRLADGKRTKLLDLGWNWFTPHFSGIASRQRPGWVLVSTYTSPDNAPHPCAREVFWLKLDGGGDIRHVAHHHSDQAMRNKTKDYWAEPHATSSWDGNIVLFASTWGQPFSQYDLYTVTGHWW